MVSKYTLGTLLALLIAACGDAGSRGLEGSLRDRFDLGFDRVRILRVGDAVAVEYVRDVSGGTLIPFKLVASGVADDQSMYDTAHLSVGRVMGADDVGPLPALEYGRLEWSGPALPGTSLRGQFDLRFVDGSALSGRFSATVEGPESDAPVVAGPTAATPGAGRAGCSARPIRPQAPFRPGLA